MKEKTFKNSSAEKPEVPVAIVNVLLLEFLS